MEMDVLKETLALLTNWIQSGHLVPILKALAILIVGFALARLASRSVGGIVKDRLTPQRAFLIQRVIYYTLAVLTIISALRKVGFEFTVLLGAAGILTVAIGFASQTSASNLISGLFLIAEEPFAVGDLVQVGSTMGYVLSIDLMAVKLRTFDNLYVRVPNETMIKSEVVNYTRFPIRRADLKIGVAYKEKLSKVKEILMDVADKNPLCLEDPKPVFIFKGFGDSSLDIQFSIWSKRENFLDLKNSIYEEIKNAFDAEGIEIPFPHISLYAGSVTAPFPIRVIKTKENAERE